MKNLFNKVLAISLFLTFYHSASCQVGYKVGDKINNFTLTNVIDNAQVSLSDYLKYKGVVLVFTSPSCPFAKLYEDRLLKLANEFGTRDVKFIFVNPNNPQTNPEDNESEMVKRAKSKNYTFPYLVDNGQQLCGSFGATKTPEAFLLKNINGSFVLQYKGAIDDNPQVATDVSNNYLRDAIGSMTSNAAIKVTEKRAAGCMIKK